MSNPPITLQELLFRPDYGPRIISMLPLDQKVAVLRAMHPLDPDLVEFYLGLLWSNPWSRSYGPYGINPITGLYQEAIPFRGWPRQMKITDLDVYD